MDRCEGIPSNHVRPTLRAGDYTVPPQHFWCCDQFSNKKICLASLTRRSEVVVPWQWNGTTKGKRSLFYYVFLVVSLQTQWMNSRNFFALNVVINHTYRSSQQRRGDTAETFVYKRIRTQFNPDKLQGCSLSRTSETIKMESWHF